MISYQTILHCAVLSPSLAAAPSTVVHHHISRLRIHLPPAKCNASSSHSDSAQKEKPAEALPN